MSHLLVADALKPCLNLTFHNLGPSFDRTMWLLLMVANPLIHCIHFVCSSRSCWHAPNLSQKSLNV